MQWIFDKVLDNNTTIEKIKIQCLIIIKHAMQIIPKFIIHKKEFMDVWWNGKTCDNNKICQEFGTSMHHNGLHDYHHNSVHMQIVADHQQIYKL